MLFSLFFIFSYSVGPIFSIPGLLYSHLYSTITKPENFPLCANFTKPKIQIWPIPNSTESTYEANWKCISTLLDTVVYENGTIGSPDGVIIESDEITKSKVPYFSDFDNTFRVYYDWIHYYSGIGSTFQKLKEKIEVEVEKTVNKEKAVLSGYSLGGNFLRYFLTHFVDDEWKSKYVDSAMFFAAGIDGSFLSSVSASIGKLFGILDIENFLPEYRNSPLIRHMPSLYSMFPNFLSHNEVMKINGRSVNASELFGEMKKISTSSKGSKIEFINVRSSEIYNFSVIVDDVSNAIYNFYLPFLEEDIRDPGVRCLLVYNSAMPAVCGANLNKIDNFKYEFSINYCGSDNIIPSNGMEYAIKHWKNVVFHDFNSTDFKFIHEQISFSKELADIIKQFIQSSDKNTLNQSMIRKIIFSSSAVFGIAIIFYFFIFEKMKLI